MNPVELDHLNINPFTAIGKEWCLVTAKRGDEVSTLTASWGGFGVVWNKNVATIYIRPQRRTREFLDATDYFTLTFFDGHHDALTYLGTVTGYDEPNKIDNTNLHVIEVDGQPTFAEAKMTFVCRKLYRQQLNNDCFIDESISKSAYPKEDFSFVYIGEIVAAFEA